MTPPPQPVGSARRFGVLTVLTMLTGAVVGLGAVGWFVRADSQPTTDRPASDLPATAATQSSSPALSPSLSAPPLVAQPAAQQSPTTTSAATEPTASQVPTDTREFPTYESTGPRVDVAEMTVHQDDFFTSHDGQVVDKMDIRGNLHILHDNVTVRDTRVMMTWNYGLDIRPTDGNCPTGTLFEYIEIDGSNATDDSVAVYGENCPWTLDHARVHNVGSAVHVVRNNTVSNSFIYSNRGETADIHRNAIQHHGGSGNKIINNTLYCEGNGCSSALALYGEVAPVEDILVEHNLLAATAGYCTYTGSLSYKPYPDGSNVRYINNHFSTKYFADCGRIGAVEGSTGTERGNVWQGNVWHETGEPVT